jgi:hypothetical protein
MYPMSYAYLEFRVSGFLGLKDMHMGLQPFSSFHVWVAQIHKVMIER